MAGCLHVVATPIGNLDDITRRAAKVLSEVETIAAEDTRRTAILLRHLGVYEGKMLALHDHNEAQATERLLPLLRSGADVALVADAGLPQIADPGFELVRRCTAEGIPVRPVPGASALSTLLSVCPLAFHQVRLVAPESVAEPAPAEGLRIHLPFEGGGRPDAHRRHWRLMGSDLRRRGQRHAHGPGRHPEHQMRHIEAEGADGEQADGRGARPDPPPAPMPNFTPPIGCSFHRVSTATFRRSATARNISQAAARCCTGSAPLATPRQPSGL